MRNEYCENCGAKLEPDREFCESCGAKIENEPVPGGNVSGAATQKSKNLPLIIVSVIAVVAIIAVIILASQSKSTGNSSGSPAIGIGKSTDDYMAEGDYQTAYEKADDDEKQLVKIESIVAERSAYSADNLKNPSSFVLRYAYYYDNVGDSGDVTPELVLYINGTNSFGGTVGNYWLYSYDDDESEWSLFCTVSDLTQEEYSKYDDTEEMGEKILDNAGRLVIKDAMSYGTELDKDAIDRINNLFEEGTLDEVKAISVYD